MKKILLATIFLVGVFFAFSPPKVYAGTYPASFTVNVFDKNMTTFVGIPVKFSGTTNPAVQGAGGKTCVGGGAFSYYNRVASMIWANAGTALGYSATYSRNTNMFGEASSWTSQNGLYSYGFHCGCNPLMVELDLSTLPNYKITKLVAAAGINETITGDNTFTINGQNDYTVFVDVTVEPKSVDGICGTANGVAQSAVPTGGELCSAGTASAVSGSGPWTWTCNGSNGGTNASCSANKIVANQCPIFSATPSTVKQGDPVKLEWSGGANVQSFDIKQQPEGGSAATILYANAQNVTSGNIDVVPSLTTTYFLDVLYNGASSKVSCPAEGVKVNVRPSQTGGDRPVPPN